jgi:RNA ligase
VLARPFPKFFNYGEHVSKGWAVPTGTPIVTEKLDGSLGILYVLDGRPWIATRGSFTSDQALWATQWWREKEAAYNLALPPSGETFLFEIIYPANRIVVNYDFSGLVFLASIDKANGRQVPRSMTGTLASGIIRDAERVPFSDLKALSKLDEPNSEGFVLYYPNDNVRMKIKFPEYVRLHKLITGINEIAIWEHLRDGKTLDDLIDKVPDEFFQWVTQTSNRLNAAFNAIRDQAEQDYNEVLASIQSGYTVDVAGPSHSIVFTPLGRKEFALAAQKKANPGILLAILDNKPTATMIWRMVRPHGGRVFKTDIDQ